jgi:hypothetical protein
MNKAAPAKAHAKYSASQSSQWLNCPGVQGMKTLVPKQKSGDAANEGTAAHELLEQCLNEGVDAFEKLDDHIYITTDEGEQLEYIVDEDMADAVQECIDVVNQYLEEYPHAEVKVEQQVDISSLCGEDMFGTVDIRIAVPFEILIIIDYKHGRGVPVQISGNTQLRYYALGSALEDDFEFAKVEMVIVQPRCPKIATYQSETITIQELKDEAQRFKTGREAAEKAANKIEKAGKPIKELLCAGTWCTFCPAQGICPAKFDQMLDIAQADFDEDYYDEEIEMPEINGLSKEQLIYILKNGDAVKKFIDKVHSDAHAQVEAGQEIEGYKLVKKKSNAKFIDDDETVIGKLVAAGFNNNDLVRTKLETLTTLRKVCGKKLIESLTYKPDTGTTLVPVEDKREAVVPSVHSDFDD